MLAASGSAVRGLDRADWRFERKLDGWRALAYINSGAVRIRTRNGRDITSSLPELAEMPRRLRDRDAILDGELIVGGGGATDFYRLGPRLARRGSKRAVIARSRSSRSTSYGSTARAHATSRI